MGIEATTRSRELSLRRRKRSEEREQYGHSVAEAWRLFHTDVLRVARYVLGSDSDADDACQETFARILRYGRKRGNRTPERKWIMTIAVNVCRTMLRRRRHTSDLTVDPTANTIQPEAAAVAREQGRIALAALDQLDAGLRVPFVLFVLEGWPVADIARSLKAPEGTIKWRLSQARSILRGALSKRLGGDDDAA